MCEIIPYPTFYTQAELLRILKFNFRILIGQTFSPTAVCAVFRSEHFAASWPEASNWTHRNAIRTAIGIVAYKGENLV